MWFGIRVDGIAPRAHRGFSKTTHRHVCGVYASYRLVLFVNKSACMAFSLQASTRMACHRYPPYLDRFPARPKHLQYALSTTTHPLPSTILMARTCIAPCCVPMHTSGGSSPTPTTLPCTKSLSMLILWGVSCACLGPSVLNVLQMSGLQSCRACLVLSGEE